MKLTRASQLLSLCAGLVFDASCFAVTTASKPSSLAAPASEGVTIDAASAAPSALGESPAQRNARMQWWREAKFGLFIHWGVYAVPAGQYGEKTSYGEWIMQSARIPAAEYRAYAQRFNPVKYNPDFCTEVARDAGMKYLVITAKHHDGFALYPSAVTTWDVADATPYGRDLLQPLVTAARDKGLKVGFYYSQSQDWMHPGGAKSGFKEGEGWDPAHRGSYDTYLASIAVPQVRELLTRYPIDILWWDTPMHMTPARIAPLAALTALRPGLVTNNRLGAGGDTATPEQFVPVTGYQGDWETCMTMNGHWGFNAADHNWKSSAELIRKLADICAKGGNFLLNVGPTAEGEFPADSIQRLREMGQWLRAQGESIYGTSAGPFAHLSWGVATRKGHRLYLHVFDWPADGKLRVPLQTAVKSAWLLKEPGRKLSVSRETERLTVSLPSVASDPVNSVVVLELAGDPVVPPLPTASAKATASAELADSVAANALDGTGAKRWRAPATATSAWLEVDLGQPAAIAGFGLDEPDVWPRLKQTYVLEVRDGSAWRKVAEGKTNGHGVKQALPLVTGQTFRLTLTCNAGSPGVAELQLYRPE